MSAAPSLRAVPSADRRAPVRLTRRGRVVVVCTGLVVLGTLLSAGGVGVATPERGSVQPYRVVTAEPGDTLWTIARRTAPGVDPRETIVRIMEFNALEGASLQVGQRIFVPVADDANG
ncbi:MAG: LysM peptidoglycan-binding domain-containing protein [Carbonactinosporaceae bacterium]